MPAIAFLFPLGDPHAHHQRSVLGQGPNHTLVALHLYYGLVAVNLQRRIAWALPCQVLVHDQVSVRFCVPTEKV